jgi:hypothetical protein
MRAAHVLFVAACGSATAPHDDTPVSNHRAEAVVPVQHFELVLERTECLGQCPAYRVTIKDGGTVEWEGKAHVTASGARRGSLTQHEIDQLDVAIEAVRFWERDKGGELPPKCDPNHICLGSITTCSDTSHAIVVITRGDKTRMIDDAHCNRPSDMSRFEDLVDQLAHTAEWIGK